MSIYGRKDKKLRRATSKKQEYLKTYESRIAKGDRSTPTYAQWASASKAEKGLLKAGVGQGKMKRLRRKK